MINPTLYSGASQRGLTLVELMIALTIGLFLVGAVSALYVNTRSSFDYSNEVARIQETGRFALDTISRDVRMAGYNGCGQSVPTVNVLQNASTNPLLDITTPIRGYEGGVDTLPSALSGAGAIAGSDAVILIGGSGSGDMVVQSHNPTSAQIDTTMHSVQAGEILIVTDCAKASVFQVSGPTNGGNNASHVVHNTGTGTPGNCTKFLGASCPGSSSYTYKPGSSMMRVFSNAYFIANSTLGNGTRALWSLTLEGSTGTPVARELLVGVDDMQIAYGLDTDKDGSVNKYVTASSVTDWTQVTAIKVSLLVRSTRTKTTTGSQPYTYMVTPNSTAESEVTPTDRILRRVFTETIVARNRTF